VIFSQYGVVAVAFLAASSMVLLVSRFWRWNLIALSIQYVAVFWITAISWPLGLATVKLIVGLMAGAVLAASQPASEGESGQMSGLSGRLFMGLAGGLVLLVVFSATPILHRWIPIQPSVLQGGILLFAMGLLQLGMTTSVLRVSIGLLTILAGFEMIYAALEASVLVAGLLGLVNLGLALVGAYLLTLNSPGKTPGDAPVLDHSAANSNPEDNL
jgi:hypothetical protein